MRKIFILIMCFFICACSKTILASREVIIDEYVPDSKKLKLTMVGDALIHTPIYKSVYENGKYNFDPIFDEFKSSIRESDLLYYNQETIIGGESLGYSGYPRFNTPASFAETMVNMGFNLVSRANNHTLDMGESGILNACNFWNRYKHVLTSGSACTMSERNPSIFETNEIKYALLSYTTTTNGLVSPNDYYVNLYDEEIVKEDINKVRNDADIVIVAMHWGVEYAKIPNDEQIKIAEYLSKLGVDIVIGTHPHVIEPITWIGNTLVIYSLGNFISNQTTTNEYARRIGLMVNIDITKTVVDHETRVTLDNLNTELIYTYKKDNKFKVIPFSKMNDTILKDYKTYKTKYDSIIKYYDNTINTN